jgi:hypothetical protein
MDTHILLPGIASVTCRHLLRFMLPRDPGRRISVPCDEAGNVDMDSLTERLRMTYLGARALVGREYACPTVQVAHSAQTGERHSGDSVLPNVRAKR